MYFLSEKISKAVTSWKCNFLDTSLSYSEVRFWEEPKAEIISALQRFERKTRRQWNMSFCRTGWPGFSVIQVLESRWFLILFNVSGKGKSCLLILQKNVSQSVFVKSSAPLTSEIHYKKLFLLSFSVVLNHFGIKLPLFLPFPVWFLSW